MTQQFEQYWDDFNDSFQKESGSGGGIIGKGRVDVGFKVYAKGFDQSDTFFASEGVAPDQRGKAKSEATKFVENNNLTANPKYGIQITMFRENSFSRGQSVTWQNDRYFNVNGWTSAATDVVIPHLREANIMLPFEGWMRISFAPDPYKQKQLDNYLAQKGKPIEELSNYEKAANGMSDSDIEGNPRLPLIAFVVEKYANETEAMKAVNTSTNDDNTSLPIPPKGLDMNEWSSVKVAIKNKLDEGVSDEEIGKFFGLDTRYISLVRS